MKLAIDTKTTARTALGGLIGGAILLTGASLVMAQDAPESLLPPGFDDPEPEPAPAPTPTQPAQPAAPRPGGTPSAPPSPGGAVVQPLPSATPSAPVSAPDVLSNLPSLNELENLSTDELDDLLGLKPQYDIPPAARRSLARIGVVGPQQGGMPSQSLANQPAALLRATINGMDGQFVSRWGHILMRRALASRLAAPKGMNPVEFAAMRASLLNRMNEFSAARSLVQSVDTGEWNSGLTDAALDSYIATADILGICPAVNLQGTARDDGQWRLLQGICKSYAGEGARAASDLNRILRSGSTPRIDSLLAQRFAGASARGRRAVNIEWDAVEELTPWRFALANALGETVPDNLLDDAAPYYSLVSATAPMLPIAQRVEGAKLAAARGIMSSSAMVDFYAQAYVFAEQDSDASETAQALRNAYIAANPAQKLEALQAVWSGDGDAYGNLVSTAFAAARLPVSNVDTADTDTLIAAMLAAGLDRNAMAWSSAVEDGSPAWAMLAVSRPGQGQSVSSSDLDDFVDADSSTNSRKAQFALAGLAGLGRLPSGDVAQFEDQLGVKLDKQTKWSRLIVRSAELDNRAMVVLLAGLGMQGDDWSRMTPAHLFRIVQSLNAVGLNGEARMIAAEAIARG